MSHHLRPAFEVEPHGLRLYHDPHCAPGEVAATVIERYGRQTVTTIVRRAAPKSPEISRKLIVHWAERMLSALDRSEAELSILLTDDKKIAELNRDYRQKDRPTDVLSFHFESVGVPSSIEAGWLLGDIVISLDTAARQAKSRKRPLEEEVRWLLAHGVLHLVGYDHATPEDKRVMVAWTRKLVRAAGDAPIETPPRATAKTSEKPRRRRPNVARPLSHRTDPKPAKTSLRGHLGRKKSSAGKPAR